MASWLNDLRSRVNTAVEANLDKLDRLVVDEDDEQRGSEVGDEEDEGDGEPLPMDQLALSPSKWFPNLLNDLGGQHDEQPDDDDDNDDDDHNSNRSDSGEQSLWSGLRKHADHPRAQAVAGKAAAMGEEGRVGGGGREGQQSGTPSLQRESSAQRQGAAALLQYQHQHTPSGEQRTGREQGEDKSIGAEQEDVPEKGAQRSDGSAQAKHGLDSLQPAQPPRPFREGEATDKVPDNAGAESGAGKSQTEGAVVEGGGIGPEQGEVDGASPQRQGSAHDQRGTGKGVEEGDSGEEQPQSPKFASVPSRPPPVLAIPQGADIRVHEASVHGDAVGARPVVAEEARQGDHRASQQQSLPQPQLQQPQPPQSQAQPQQPQPQQPQQPQPQQPQPQPQPCAQCVVVQRERDAAKSQASAAHQAEQALADECSKLRRALRAHEEEAAAARREATQREAECERLGRENGEQRRKCEGLQHEAREREGQLERAQEQWAMEQSRAEMLAASLKGAQEERVQLLSQLDAVRGKLRTEEQRYGEVHKALQASEKEKEDMHARVTDLQRVKGAFDERSEQLRSLRTALATAQRERDEAERMCEGLRGENDRLQVALDELTSKETSLSSQATHSSQQLSDSKFLIKQLQSQLAEAEAAAREQEEAHAKALQGAEERDRAQEQTISDLLVQLAHAKRVADEKESERSQLQQQLAIAQDEAQAALSKQQDSHHAHQLHTQRTAQLEEEVGALQAALEQANAQLGESKALWEGEKRALEAACAAAKAKGSAPKEGVAEDTGKDERIRTLERSVLDLTTHLSHKQEEINRLRQLATIKTAGNREAERSRPQQGAGDVEKGDGNPRPGPGGLVPLVSLVPRPVVKEYRRVGQVARAVDAHTEALAWHLVQPHWRLALLTYLLVLHVMAVW